MGQVYLLFFLKTCHRALTWNGTASPHACQYGGCLNVQDGEMVGQWNGWKNDGSILRIMASQRTHENKIMEEGISESCDGDLHTIIQFFLVLFSLLGFWTLFRVLSPFVGFLTLFEGFKPFCEIFWPFCGFFGLF